MMTNRVIFMPPELPPTYEQFKAAMEATGVKFTEKQLKILYKGRFGQPSPQSDPTSPEYHACEMFNRTAREAIKMGVEARAGRLPVVVGPLAAVSFFEDQECPGAHA